MSPFARVPLFTAVLRDCCHVMITLRLHWLKEYAEFLLSDSCAVGEVTGMLSSGLFGTRRPLTCQAAAYPVHGRFLSAEETGVFTLGVRRAVTGYAATCIIVGIQFTQRDRYWRGTLVSKPEILQSPGSYIVVVMASLILVCFHLWSLVENGWKILILNRRSVHGPQVRWRVN